MSHNPNETENQSAPPLQSEAHTSEAGGSDAGASRGEVANAPQGGACEPPPTSSFEKEGAQDDPLDRYAKDPTMPAYADPECRAYSDACAAEREEAEREEEKKRKAQEAALKASDRALLKAERRSRAATRTSAAAFRGELPHEDDPLLGFEPAPHVAARRNSITAERQREFIAELAASGVVTQAARKIGASLEALYRLRNKPGADEFAAAWEMALDRGVARLEDCALERALQGEERPIVSAGKLLGTWRKHDNSLLMFLLRQRRDTRYTLGAAQEIRPGSKAWQKAKVAWQNEASVTGRKAKQSLSDMILDFERRTRKRIRDELEKEVEEKYAAREAQLAAPALPAPDGADGPAESESESPPPAGGPRVHFM
jgi:hypothetical protein